MPMTEEGILRSEFRWAAVAVGAVSVIMLALIYAGLVHHINPPSNLETIDPNTLHLTSEFTESNLGTRVAADGQVTSRIVATQFAFQPQCIAMEIAGRLRGGRGLFGWIAALPWDRPMVLATGLAFLMLWFGGLGA